MATSAAPSNVAATPEAAPHPYADLVEDHVRRTQGYLRSCDIAGAVITIVVFLLGYLMAMALIDHWVWPGGLGRGGRILACVTMLVLVGVYAWRALLPHLLRRINPVYAADRLERAQPSLMNSLVNLLMLRSQERHISDAVMRGLERQAATGIEHLPAEAAVDRRKLLRTAYVLVGVLLFCALYVVFSPKSPLISAARILIPWADISAVTRVRIEKVRPGSEDVYRGEPVTVTAEIRGLRDDEPVTLRYASVDGQTDNQSVAMFRREGQTTHSCQLPPDTAGMQRDLDYQIEAGDTKSAQFRLHVVPAPTIQIESIEYRYPAYTGMPPLTVERLGDIKGLEGTQVIIRAKSSQPIGTASLQLTGLRDTTLPMQTRGELAARVELPLKLVNVQGSRDPQYTSYKLDVTNAKGNHNREPASYRIEVTPDFPPQVDVFEPRERDIQLPADKELSIEVRARDADFALSDVRLLATRKGERLLDESLVKDRKVRLDQPVRTAYRFVPGRHGLKAGDEVLFRVAAIDNKRPQPNRQLTPEYRIAIVAPEAAPLQKREPSQQENMQREGTPQQQEDQVAAGKAPQEEGSAKGEKSEKSAKSEKGAKSERSAKGEGSESGSGSESQGSESSEQKKDGASKTKDEGDGAGSDSASAGSDPIDDGEAVQRIVKHLEQQGKKPEDQKQSGDSSDNKSGDESQVASADKQDSKQDNKQDSKQKDSQKPDKGDSQKSPKDDQQGSQQPDSKDQSGASPDEKSNDEKQGEKQAGDKSGQKKDGQKQGSQKSQSGQQGQSQSGGGGKSEQQGSQSGSQGNSSGQGQESSSEQSSGDQQGSSKEDSPKKGTPSSSTQGQKGSSSSDSKQSGSGDRQTQQAQSNPSNKSSSGAGQADSKQQGSQPGDQTAQKQPGEATTNEHAKGEKSEGGKKPEDQVASNDAALKQDGQKQPGQKQSGTEKSSTEKSGEGQSAGQQTGEMPDSAKAPGMNPGERDPQSQPRKQLEATDGGKPQSGGAQGRQQEDGSSGEGNRPEDKAKDITQKSGESSDNRASGDAKEKPQDNARAPGKTPAKGQQAASDSKTSEEDSKAPEKQRPSDTGSDQGGERAGKGQEGMGQASSGAGGGSAGMNQAADDGGNRSRQSGPGDQSNRAGNQQQSDKATGKAGQQAGDARSGRPENDKRQAGDSQRRPEDGQPSEPTPEAPQGMQPGQGQQVEGQPAQQPSGSGGDPAAGKSGPSSSKPSGTVVPGSEQANLEYSKRATDLTLTYLQDQLAKGHIDDGLRKRLGWSEEEFQSLLKRMQSMRDRGADAAAKPEDKQAYEQWLKSLGLRPSTGAVRTGKVESKPLANSRDDAPVSVPRDLREQHEAFRQGLLEKSR